MKVGLYETVEVSDDQRRDLARLIDKEGAPARLATRDEIKTFIWSCGARWAEALASGRAHLSAVPDSGDPEDPGDLLGAPVPSSGPYDESADGLDAESLL